METEIVIHGDRLPWAVYPSSMGLRFDGTQAAVAELHDYMRKDRDL